MLTLLLLFQFFYSLFQKGEVFLLQGSFFVPVESASITGNKAKIM